MSVTIKDVAYAAGVSVATVSKYINGGNVLEENRKKIKCAIDKLNYRVNEVARNLRTNKTKTIGILAPDIGGYFTSAVIADVQYELIKRGYSILILDYRSDKKLEGKQVDFLLDRMVDGIIFFPIDDEKDIINRIQQNNIPVVIVDNMVNNCSCDAVLVDNMGAAYRAVEELIVKNHKRIGIITGTENMYTSKERIKGYMRACEDYFIPVDKTLIKYGRYVIKGGYKCFNELMNIENPPTAVFAADYYMTVGSLLAINERNIKVPDDLSFVGFDSMEIGKIFKPNITTVLQPVKDIAFKTAEILLKRLDGQNDGFPCILRLKTNMKVTSSIANRKLK